MLQTKQSPEQALDAVRNSYLATVDSGTARMALDAQFAADLGGTTQTATMTGTGWFDFTRRMSQANITTPFGLEIEIYTEGVDFYEKAPADIRNKFPGDKPWLRFDFEAADRAQYGGPIYVFRADGGDDPWQMLGVMPAVSAVRFVGLGQAGGVEASHYEGVLRLADFAELGDAETAAGRRGFMAKIGIEELPVEAWLDEAGRLRRVQATVPLTLPSLDMAVSATGVLEFSEFGASPEIAGPTAGEAHDITDVISDRGLSAVGQMLGIL